MKNWIKIFFGFLTLGCNSQTIDLSKTEFTKLYLDALKSKYPEVNFTIESDLTIKADYKGQVFSYFFDNSYLEYQMDKDSLNRVISKYINAIGDAFNEKAGIQIDRIVPIIKPIDFLNDIMQLAANTAITEPWIVYEKYNDKLIIAYGEDTEKNFNYLTKVDLNKLNISADTLRELAVKNLTRILPNIQKVNENAMFGLIAGGDYEASLILLEFLWTKENFNVDGDFVIAIPTRDVILITGSNNSMEIERIKAITKETYNKGDHQISPYLFIWKGDRFEEFPESK